jgi:hypothetical protein
MLLIILMPLKAGNIRGGVVEIRRHHETATA